MPRLLSLFITILLCIGLFSQAHGQQEDTQESLLPDIDPQDIEIRSQFQARFPGLNRQPILGFDPEPRVYQISSDRTPFMETDEQVVANLPISELSRPTPPAAETLAYSPDISTFSRLGGGSFSSAVARFWGVHRINSKSYVGGDLDYSSSGGHLEEQPSSFRFFNANVDYATEIGDKTQLHMTLGGRSDFNYLQNESSMLNELPRKAYTAVNFSADVQKFTNSVEGWSALAEARFFNAQIDAEPYSGNKDETIYRGSFSKRWAGNNINETFTVKAGAKAGVYGNESTEDQDGWTTVQGGAEYQRLFNYNTELKADASLYYITNPFEDTFYLGPTVEVVHSLTDKIQLTGKAGAKPYLKTVEQHHLSNRFLNTENQFMHTYSIDVSGNASLEYYRGSTVEGGISFMNARNYPYYNRNLVSEVTSDPFYTLRYMDAHKLKIFAGITHQLIPERFWVSGRIYAQDAELDNGSRIPYTENWGLNSSISLQVLEGLHVEGWADYVGSRRASIDNEKLDGFLLIGGQVDFEITERVGAYVEVANLLSQEYEIWDGYTERPFQLFGGITLKF